jgi:hypothetical protein
LQALEANSTILQNNHTKSKRVQLHISRHIESIAKIIMTTISVVSSFEIVASIILNLDIMVVVRV